MVWTIKSLNILGLYSHAEEDQLRNFLWHKQELCVTINSEARCYSYITTHITSHLIVNVLLV